uniref:hypothetical protein n=1 Tax=Cephaleuros karstenii TaxID=1985640 RepID=UPI001EE0DC26|nr:hypothetical protein MFR52_pgp049 [Cephaleuros karstenii]UIB39110.1 hypothetical protein [Cephaleuros karstenii]
MGRFATTQQFFFDASWQIVRKMKKSFHYATKFFVASWKIVPLFFLNCCVVEDRLVPLRSNLKKIMGRFATTQQFFFDASWQIVRKMKKFFPLRNKIFCCVVENRPIIFFKLLRSGRSFSSTTQQFKKNNGTICHDAAIFFFLRRGKSLGK